MTATSALDHQAAAERVIEAFHARLDELPARIKPWYQVGQPGFEKIGAQYLRLLQELCDMTPQHRLLDMGCGIGRISIHFAPFFAPEGGYGGTDIVPEAIAWANDVFAPLHNFEFKHADIYNAFYNPSGTERAASYRFPFSDDHFDAALLTSVFTHMLPPDVTNYCRELARCVRADGRMLITTYLIDDIAKRQIKAGAANRKFLRCGINHYAPNKDNQEACIGLRESWLLGKLERSGLSLAGPIQYGAWSGRPGNSGREQDLLVLSVD